MSIGGSPSPPSGPAGQYAQDSTQRVRQDASKPVVPSSTLAVYAASLPAASINSFCGAMAGVASGIVTCPLDVIKTKLQAQSAFRRSANLSQTSKNIYSGMLGTASTIWHNEGLRGMYRGLGPMLLGYFPTWAVYMSVYDTSKDVYYKKVGEYPERSAFPVANLDRKQVVCTHIRIGHCWRLLHPRDESHLGHQDQADVSSRPKESG